MPGPVARPSWVTRYDPSSSQTAASANVVAPGMRKHRATRSTASPRGKAPSCTRQPRRSGAHRRASAIRCASAGFDGPPDGVEPWPSANLDVRAASTPPSSWYTSERVQAAEEERVFRRGWQAAGRADQVENPGDYFTGELLRTRFVVVRGDDGHLRCFHNVCRHHAMAVASGSGNLLNRGAEKGPHQGAPAKAACFACPYHGWTYDTSGKLIKATRLTGIEGFSAGENGLVELRAEVWGPFVFVHLGGGSVVGPGEDNAVQQPPVPPVSEWLREGGLSRALEAGRVSDPSLRFVARREYELSCNWKVFCDNYLDGGYHVPFAHPGLSSGVDMKSYATEAFAGGHSVQSVKGEEGPSSDPRLGSEACYGFVYPNFMVNRYGPWLDTNWAVPLGPERCKIVFDYYLEEHLLNDAAFIEESLAASDAVQQEDTELCHGVQAGVASTGYDTGRYVPSVEGAMFHFHQALYSDLLRQ